MKLDEIHQKWIDIGLIRPHKKPETFHRGGSGGGFIPGVDSLQDSDGNLLVDSDSNYLTES